MMPALAATEASSPLGFFTNNGNYMPRVHCLQTENGAPDWGWIAALVVLNLIIIVGYLRIFFFWRRSYRSEAPADRNKKMMDLAYIFLWCAVCGYGMSLVIFFWPGYRLLAVFLGILAFFTWRFVLRLDELGVSLAAVRLRRLSLVADNTSNSVLISDAQGRIEWVNQAFTKQTGYELGESVGKVPSQLCSGPETDPEIARQIMDHIESGTGFEMEVVRYTKAGEKRWVNLSVQPLHNKAGELHGFVSVENDVTARRLADEETLASKRHVEQALAEAEERETRLRSPRPRRKKPASSPKPQEVRHLKPS